MLHFCFGQMVAELCEGFHCVFDVNEGGLDFLETRKGFEDLL